MKREVSDMKLSDIHFDDDFNCRGRIMPIDVVDLAKDIAERGVIQPIIVAPYDDEKKQQLGFPYKLIAGHRRYTACRVNSMTTIPAIIREDMTDEAEARFFNLAENVQRADLNPVQEAYALKKLLSLGHNRDEIAKRTGKSPGWVQIRVMILNMPEEVQEEIKAGYITQGQIRELYSVWTSTDKNKDKLFEAVRELKDAKIKGTKPKTIDPNKKKIVAKRQRSRQEIFEMLFHIQDYVPNGLWSVAMSWCAGEASDQDLFDIVKKAAEAEGLIYSAPINEQGELQLAARE